MFYEKNREQFFAQMPLNSVAIIFSAKQKQRSNDTNFPFRQDSNFYYLTGFLEDDAVLVMKKDENKNESILFVHPKDPLKEMWEGKCLGVDKALTTLKVDRSFSIKEFDKELPELLKECHLLYCQTSLKAKNIDPILIKLQATKEGHLYPTTYKQIEKPILELRRKKQAYEIDHIRSALEITQKAHHAAMAAAKPSKYEYDVMAIVEYIFKTGGASWDAYTTIVAGGNNANTLHYVSNEHRLVDGDLILMDAGSEFKLYASDITRCFPVNGKFSSAQKEVYEIVLKTQKAVIAEIKPGVFRSYIGDLAIRMLSQGLIDLKILDEALEEIIEKELYKPYYPHGIGHWMGLDVHDPLAYKDENDKELAFEAGDVLTIEPGLYLEASDKKIPKKYRGIGVRIEDNILVTKTGHENLSFGIAKEIEEIEKRCQADLYSFI